MTQSFLYYSRYCSAVQSYAAAEPLMAAGQKGLSPRIRAATTTSINIATQTCPPPIPPPPGRLSSVRLSPCAQFLHPFGSGSGLETNQEATAARAVSHGSAW